MYVPKAIPTGYSSSFLISLFIQLTKSFKYFRAYHLKSGEILLITEESIKLLNLTNQIQSTLYELNLFSSKDDIQYISFAQSLYDEGEYLFCRVKQLIYISIIIIIKQYI